MEKNSFDRILRPASAIAVCIGIVLCLIYYVRPSHPDIIVFGDSRIVGDGLQYTIPELIEKETGLKTVSGAFGGMMLADLREDRYESKQDSFSMEALSRFALLKDLKSIAAITGGKSNFFRMRTSYSETAEQLAKQDISKAGYIIIAQGVNDAMMGVAAEDPGDPYNRNTYAGALRTSVENLSKAAASARIILVIPAYYDISVVTDRQAGPVSPDHYSEVIRKIAAEYDLYVADLYEGTGINADNSSEYLADGLHFNDKGAAKAASVIIDIIQGSKDR